MNETTNEHNVFEFVSKIGSDVGVSTAKNIEIQYQKTFDYLPELAILIVSCVVKKTFTIKTSAPKNIKDGICFSFSNMFEDGEKSNGRKILKTQDKMSYVQVFPHAYEQKHILKKGTNVNALSVTISAGYLKSFLKQDAQKFQFLFDNEEIFLIEEIMTDDILRAVNDLVKREQPNTLTSYHYKLKVMELLFYLFQSLSNREKSVQLKLSDKEINSIYKVRDKLVSSLQKPSPIEELKQIAGMNELKMRKLFTQVFGMGIYDYYQHLRMKEAARLLRDENLSVSEVGYKMGFENLSHFTKVFEKHIGKKPKKYQGSLI